MEAIFAYPLYRKGSLIFAPCLSAGSMETTTPAPGPPKTILMVNTPGASGAVTFQSMNASVPLPSCLDGITQPQVPPNTASSATGVYLMGPAWTLSEGKMVLAWPGDPGEMNVHIALRWAPIGVRKLRRRFRRRGRGLRLLEVHSWNGGAGRMDTDREPHLGGSAVSLEAQ